MFRTLALASRPSAPAVRRQWEDLVVGSTRHTAALPDQAPVRWLRLGACTKALPRPRDPLTDQRGQALEERPRCPVVLPGPGAGRASRGPASCVLCCWESPARIHVEAHEVRCGRDRGWAHVLLSLTVPRARQLQP